LCETKLSELENEQENIYLNIAQLSEKEISLQKIHCQICLSSSCSIHYESQGSSISIFGECAQENINRLRDNIIDLKNIENGLIERIQIIETEINQCNASGLTKIQCGAELSKLEAEQEIINLHIDQLAEEEMSLQDTYCQTCNLTYCQVYPITSGSSVNVGGECTQEFINRFKDNIIDLKNIENELIETIQTIETETNQCN
jgi:hypothetical protein